MAIKIHIDIIEGAALTVDKDGAKVTRIATITGLPNTGSAQLLEVITAPTFPQPLEEHPTILGIYVDVISIQADEKGIATATITYKPLDMDDVAPDDEATPEVEIGATVQEVETEKDKDGDPLYVYPVTDGIDGVQAQAKVMVPMVKFMHRRKEPVSPAVEAKAEVFVGCVNSTTWRSAAARTWLCTGITGTLVDKGTAIMVTYEFQKNKQTWDAPLVHIDTKTDRITPGSPVSTYRVYPEEDFNELDL